MKKSLVTLVLSVLVSIVVMPLHARGTPFGLFSGEGTARALEISVPALKTVASTASSADPQVGKLLKGLTIGATGAAFKSTPEIHGYAAGQCELLGSNPDPKALPCDQASTEVSSAPGVTGSGGGKCADSLQVAVVNLDSACGRSSSKIESSNLFGDNEAAVAKARLSLNLDDLGFKQFVDSEPLKDFAVNAIASVTNYVFQVAPDQAKADALHEAISDFLESIKEGGQAAAIKAGASTTRVDTVGDVTTVVSEAAGGTVGLLGLRDALSDGLIIVSISSGKATATVNALTGSANAGAVPALASIKLRDLVDLDDNPATAYIERDVTVEQMNSLLAPLSSTPLDISIEAATATQPQSGTAASASTTGVGVRALSGLGESSAGRKDGGLSLRFAYAAVSTSVALVRSEKCCLAATGGPTPFYVGGAFVLAAAAAAVLHLSRKLRRAV